MQSYKGRFEPTRFSDLTVTVDFHCHSACRFCIAAEGLNYFRGVPFDRFKEAVDDNVRHRRYRRVTFTGGEVTLEEKLFDYLVYARDSKSFDHIRLQTNGRLLADRSFAERLMEAGVDEFFVSLHGPNAAVQDHIAQRPGGFDETMRGLENLRALGACILTNTVLTTLNVDHLAAIVDTVFPFRPAGMEWWNYLPMEDYADERGLLVPMARLAPALVAALDRAHSLGIECRVKYVPQCLLGAHAEAMDNAQPDVVIVEAFYEVYPEFACLYEAKCEHAETCLGLTHPYIEKFGWEADLLQPVPRSRPWQEPEYGLPVESDAPDGSEVPPSELPAWRALIEGVAESTGARLEEMLLTRRACIYRFAAGAGSVDVVLEARDEARPALHRSASFNIYYKNVRDERGEAKEALTSVIRAAVEAIDARDPGGLHLDGRKGLVGSEYFRRRARR
ncbi:MAG: radical SAM protein [Deltaproteobacteria bacterium]|nr:MAG: radical SAM protein [Deltaproteobacteria bacterium]